ncbi:head-to-tail stopper [Bacillus phage 031MP004]|nr:head-to-tail stopper [Bacillus phage 031MP004]QFG05771.1 head-to-tail stopper [Bacillus phage 055SW001]
MRPPMRQEAIIFFEDRTKPTDRHGKYPETVTHTKARVKFTTVVVEDVNGVDRQARLEVDLPPDIDLYNGIRIKARDPLGEWHEAEVVNIDDSLTLAGNRLLFRTVLCA